MGLFTKQKNVIGIDIGADSVKLVQLSDQNKKPTLVTYGMAEESIDIVRDTSDESTAKLVYIIKQVVQQSHMTTQSVIAALPTFSVFSSILSLPAMPKKDLQQAVRWEAKKFVPMPLEEMILDWKELKSLNQLKRERSGAQANNVGEGENEAEKKSAEAEQSVAPDHMRVLITAAPKTLVSRYVSVIKAAGLQLASLETEAFAIARSLTSSQRGTVMIVDLGSVTTDIIVIEDGVPVMNRSIDVGGRTLTNAIAQSLHIDTTRAEQFKRDIGVNQSAGSAIPRVMRQTMQPILQEISYSHNLYVSQTNQSVDKIILTGGSALLPSIETFLAEVTNINTYLGDPWMHVSYPEELKPALDEIGSRLPVSIGLALKPMA